MINQKKIFWSLTAITLLTALSIFGVSYLKARQALFKQIQSKLLSTSVTGALMVNGDLHEKVQGYTDQNTDSYKKLEKILRDIRNANRRKDFYVEYVYTLRRDTEYKDTVRFIIDAEEAGPNKSNVNDAYMPIKQDFHGDFKSMKVLPGFITDQWGSFLIAYAPIYDSKGNQVATLGVDIDKAKVITIYQEYLFSNWPLLPIVTLIIILNWFIAYHLHKPLYRIYIQHQTIKTRYLQKLPSINTNNEYHFIENNLDNIEKSFIEKENLYSALCKYTSQDIVAGLIGGKSLDLNVERKKITVLFADIRGFTNLSENLIPEQVASLLYQYFDKMVEAIHKNHGYLDKFLGDGLMALFGAVKDDPYQEENAINAALDMLESLQALKERWSTTYEQGKSKALDNILNLSIGIGINTGVAVVGNIGTKDKMEFTALGDTVNLGSRIESATKELDIPILVSEYTFVSVRSLYKFSPAKEIQVKGKSEPIKVYGLIAPVEYQTLNLK